MKKVKKTDKWEKLLTGIRNNEVIPILGQDLYRVSRGDDKEFLLYPYLAQKLSPEIMTKNYTKITFRKAMSLYQGEKPIDYKGIRNFFKWALSGLLLTKGGPLEKLASIKQFPIFINTTYDLLFEKVLKETKRKPITIANHTSREKKYDMFADFIIEENTKNGVIVFNLFGSTLKNISPAYPGPGLFDHINTLISDKGFDVSNKFFRTIENKSLLFIGCGFDGPTYSLLTKALGNRYKQEVFIVDDFSAYNNNGLKEIKARGQVNLFDYGDSSMFVNELSFFVSNNDKEMDLLKVKKSSYPRASVFISYHRSDRDFAKKVAEMLIQDGVAVWIDSSDLEPGDEHVEEIIKAILKYPIFLPIISENTHNALKQAGDKLPYFLREWEWAYSHHMSMQKPGLIIPIKVYESKWIWNPFSNYSCVYLGGKSQEGGYNRLLSRLYEIGNDRYEK